jgi:phosphoribosyl 1,2-cyclic phosphate phosphodiesterase
VKLTFLGTGTSFGVPQLGCPCAVCHSADPRDQRTRVGAALETDGGAVILLDTPPELRLQLLGAGITHVEAVLYTHGLEDHTHGIDDLRAFTVLQGQHLPVYGAHDTLAGLTRKFDYIFDDAIKALPGTYKPQARAIELEPGRPTRIADVEVTAVPVPHGPVTVFAYRIGALAYVTDAKRVPPDAVAVLRGARVLVVNALFQHPHPSHLSVGEALQVAKEVGAERTYLTHLTHESSHAALAARLPAGVEPAYDGLQITI